MMQNAILFPKTPFAQFKTDDGDLGLKIRYVGTEASGTVAVSSAGDLTFKIGAAGAEVVDDTINSGAATGGGSDAGVIDVSDGSNLTFGQVVDMINSSSNWSAYLVGVLRTDNANASTGSLLTLAETTLAINEEVGVYKDTSKVHNITIRVGRRTTVNGSEAKSAAEIYRITSLNTFGSGTNTIEVYCIDEFTKTEELVYSNKGGATTVEDTKNFVVNGRGSLAVEHEGQYLLVRMVGSAACTGSLQVLGATAAGN